MLFIVDTAHRQPRCEWLGLCSETAELPSERQLERDGWQFSDRNNRQDDGHGSSAKGGQVASD